MKSYAPVVLFVYNRPRHTKQTVDALKLNDGAKKTDLIIYSDAPKNDESKPQVNSVRDHIRKIDGFKSVRIIEREENWGLAQSIIQGVTEVVNQYGKVIVLEDDIVTSPAFLQFMNQALKFYENEKKVWHISGWNYPIDFKEVGDAFLWRGMNCWGWATWADRWQYFEKDPEALISEWTDEEKSRFDLDGTGLYWSQVEANANDEINTWAIFWYATIFYNQGICLNPSVSYGENIGHDGTGVHCGVDTTHFVGELNNKIDIVFPSQIYESTDAVMKIKEFQKGLKRPFAVRVLSKISTILVGRRLL
nr:glycosyltransferase [Halomonas sp. Mc5H-6]